MWSIGRQSSNKVQGYLLEWKRIVCCGDAVQWCALAMRDILVLLAHRASCNVVCDPGLHSGPPVCMRDLGEGLVSAGVSHGQCVVQYLKDLVSEFFIWGNY